MDRAAAMATHTPGRHVSLNGLGQCDIELDGTPRSQVVRTLEYGPLNQPITALLVPERYSKYILYRDNCLTNEAKE